MEIDHPEARSYLYELYTQTQGDTEKQVSMYDIGASIGLEKTDAATMAESLFIQGLAELKTLSGGIGITRQGLEALDIDVPVELKDGCYQLPSDRILEDQGKEAVEQLIVEIKDSIPQMTLSYGQLEEIVVDIKTIEVQLLSPNPKIEVIREIIRSLQESLMNNGSKSLIQKLHTLIT